MFEGELTCLHLCESLRSRSAHPCQAQEHPMKSLKNGGNTRIKVPDQTAPRRRQEGKLGWIFLWLIGIPIPLLLVLFLVRGCT